MGIVENLVTNIKDPSHKSICHKNIVRKVFELADGRLISCSDDDYIIIYNKYNIDEIDIKIKNNELGVMDLIEIKDGIILTCCINLKIIEINKNTYKIIQILNPHKELINRIIKLSNGLIATCSDDQKIQFYKYENDELKLNDSINTSYRIYSIFECSKNEIISYCGKIYENYLKFYDIENKQETLKIKVKYYVLIPIYDKLNDKFLVVGDYGRIIVINLINHSLHQIINLEYRYYILCCLKLNDNTFFCGDNKGNLYEFNIRNNSLLLKEVARGHDDMIFYLSKYKGNKLISCSKDHSIKIW